MMYKTHPEKLKKSEKSLDYNTLISFETIEEAKMSLIEKEVDSVIRNDHLSQIKYFEKNLNITLQSDPEIIQKFVEITERRNLFVHCDGIVNKQYMTICCNSEEEKQVEIGEKLKVSPEYFMHSVDTILEIGVKISHIIWNKLQPKETDTVQKSLNHVAYELIYTEKFELAIKILDFALTIFNNNLLDHNKLYYSVNKAQAYKWLGESDKMQKTISEVEWTTLSPLFQISYYVLTDDFENAANLMYVIHKSNELTKSDYQVWPLFKEFRKSDQFKKVYKELYGEESSSFKKVNPKPLSNILSLENL